MINFLLLMAVPMIISLVALLCFKGKVTIYEFLGQIAAVAVFVGICLGVSYFGRTIDREIWNGQVTSRSRDIVSCSHSYECNCSTDSKGNRHCSTCYEHSYDVDWTVHSNIGDVTIDREDRQGLIEPPRWDAAFPGEPFSAEHHYVNYILANPDTVLLGGKGDVEKFKSLIPEYPRVFDYYRVDHVINMGVPLPNQQAWNWLMNEADKTLGPRKQANVLLLFVKTADPTYTLALKDVWFGSKKNDLVVVIGSVDGHKIEFADVVSWTPREDLKVELRDAIEKIGTLDQRDQIVATITDITNSKFQRMHMKDMEYLMRSFQPSGAAMLWSFILSTLLSLGLAIWSIYNDITDDNPTGGYRRLSRSYY